MFALFVLLFFILPVVVVSIAVTASSAAGEREYRKRFSPEAAAARQKLEWQQRIAEITRERVELATYEPERYNRKNTPKWLGEGDWPTEEAIARAKLAPRQTSIIDPNYGVGVPGNYSVPSTADKSCGISSAEANQIAANAVTGAVVGYVIGSSIADSW